MNDDDESQVAYQNGKEEDNEFGGEGDGVA